MREFFWGKIPQQLFEKKREKENLNLIYFPNVKYQNERNQ